MTRRLVGFLLLATCVALVACGGGGGSSGPSVQPRAITYTAIGASDAVGIGALPLSNGYVPRLADALRTRVASVEVVNLGRSGWEASQMVAGQLPDAIASDPDVVTIWTGSNDLIAGVDPDVFAGYLEQLLAGLTQQTTATVFVGDLVDLTQAPSFVADPDPDVTAERVAAFNDRIHAAVATYGCVLVELSQIPFDEDSFAIDGFHPSNQGHAAIASAFWAQIAPLL